MALLNRFQYTQVHMGVPVRLTLYAPDASTAERAGRAAYARFAELEQVTSDYRATSELMRLCARSGGPPVPVSPDLFRVLERAQRVARESTVPLT
jgi:thiamine biosynthesis lipoprotein